MTYSQMVSHGDSPSKGPLPGGAGGLAEVLRALLRRVGAVFGIGPGARAQRFSAALVALAAKMAKADGVATQGEFEAFCEVFTFDAGQQRRVRALYDLAKRDSAGFDAYARRIARDFEDDCALLEDVLDGLFHVAKADGAIHDHERVQLEIIAEIFGFSTRAFEGLMARHADGGASDPYRVLGVARDIDDGALKAHYRRLVAENHPDRLIARGLPEQMIRIANERLAAINAAYGQIAQARGL